MFSNHVSRELSAYHHSELGAEDSARVSRHLLQCTRCRAEYDEIKLGASLAQNLLPVHAPATLWNDIESVLSAQNQVVPSRLTSRPRLAFAHPRLIAAGVSIAVIAALGFWYVRIKSNTSPEIAGMALQEAAEGTANPNAVANNPNPPNVDRVSNSTLKGWNVARISGAPMVGSAAIADSGRLGVGEWLETDNSSRAEIMVADIGKVEVAPNSRVRLVQTDATGHRLALARGRLQAVIKAPPRLFIVDTPSAIAVDLGCAYTLDVDDSGASVLHVTAGYVALERGGRESIVPAGAICLTKPGIGPGTPYFADATLKFREALRRLDFENGGTAELAVILSEANDIDTLTLWHLIPRVKPGDRVRVYDQLAKMVAPPAGVTRAGVLALDRKMLERWREELERTWFG